MKESGVEWLGKVPAHWAVRRFKYSTISCQNGLWGADPNGSDDIECVRVADFDRYALSVRPEIPTVRAVPEKDRHGRVLSPGNLLLEKSGGGERQPVGQVVIYNRDTPAICSNFIARIELADGMDPWYWNYQHWAAYCYRLNTRSIKQTSGIQNLDQRQYLNELAAFPPPREQKEIAAYLDRVTVRIDTLIVKKSRFIELLREKRHALIAHAVTKGLDATVPMKDSGVQWLGLIPRHWSAFPSRRLFAVRSEPAKPDDRVLSASQKYGVLYQSDFVEIEGRRVAEVILGIANLKHVEPDDFIISMRSFQGGLEWCQLRGSTSFHYVMVTPKKNVWPAFFAHLFKSAPYIHALRRTSDLIRDGQELRYSNFIEVPLPVIPIEEQKKIAIYLDNAISRIDTLVANTERSVELLREHSKALITAAVTGKIDLRNAAKEHA